MPIDRLLPAPYNPRRPLLPGDPEYEALKRSVQEFGLVEPLVWNRRTGRLVGGHQRLRVLRDLGVREVEVSVVDLDEERERLLNLALNRIQGDWDQEKLRELLDELDRAGAALDLSGFTEREVEEILAGLAADPGDLGDAEEDEVPEPPEEPVTRPGDLWILGRHRLLCGDATVADHVARLLGDAKPKLMVTDPPYGVEYDPEWRVKAMGDGAARRRGRVSNDDRADWYDAWVLFPGDVVYCWHGGLHADVVKHSLERAGFEIRAQIIWAKPRHALSRGHYHWQHEPCWYAVRRGAEAHWIGNRSQTTLWEIPIFDGDDQKVHGTQKPLECMARPLRNHAGDVYDPFVGTGTTIIAAERFRRRCYAMEIDPRYCDVAIQRWQNCTGQKAVREDGTPFDALKAEQAAAR